jgi:F-type H+-transporting ATPase subunit epsilon
MFKVSIFDQERKLYEARASQVTLPGVEGELAVLDFHAPVISLLKAGRISVDGKYLLIRQGVAMMDRNELVVLVER